MLGVKDANHLFLFNYEHRGRGNRRCRSYPYRLTGKAALAKKIARSQNRDDRLFTGLIDYREPHAAILNVEDIFSGIALREDRCLFLKLRNLASHPRRIKKSLGIERGLLLEFRFGFDA